MKDFYTTRFGRGQHGVSFHDGVSTHSDGSPFYGLRLFKTERKQAAYVRELKAQGYVYRATCITPCAKLTVGGV
jgi:hypothetical protein